MSASGSPEMNDKNEESGCDEEFVQIVNPEDQLTDEEISKVPVLIGNELPEDCHIKQLLGYFTQNTYTASEVDPRVQIALDTCMKFIEKDYTVTKIDNQNGILSTYYPAIIPYLDGEKVDKTTASEGTDTTNDLSELLRKSYRARCRQRFPVPVIMYKGRCICRSATLAGSAEIYGRMTLDMFRPGNLPQGDGSLDEMIAAQLSDDETGWKAINEVQIADIALLKQLNVSTIVDLMVENRKSKLGVPVTSSEKVDKDNKYHSNFNLLSLPFPGCEFFKEFHDKNYNAKGLHFNWDQPMCDAELFVPDYPALDYLNIDWGDYKKWDIVQMTQNYIRYILKYLQDINSGILIHCISGWDRTPLFISLLRMSLWADGLIHKSLDVKEMLYFTLAYDWMLFGHHLTDRLSKNEDILLFCFTVLKYLMDDRFSLLTPSRLLLTKKLSGSSTDLSAKSPERRTDGFPIFDESDSAELAREHELMGPLSPVMARRSPEIVFPEESNDSMDFSVGITVPLIAPSCPVGILTEENLDSISMDIGEGPYSQEFESLDSFKSLPVEVLQRNDDEFDCPCSPGNWQMVSATGSVRGSDSQSDQSSLGMGDDGLSRRGRLTQIRRLFYRCYYQTLTEKHVNYTNNTSVLRTILRNLNDMAINFTGEKQQQ